ncbi:putative outer membrane repeat protein [Methanobrevibacter gottschalkii DSM 11977]|uniref:Putative outer membrane repeat protein n=2 Tax=Methanobrevibacter TaxID=2172 RepID=A0A3N5B3R5_9EURY|nr:putative outer membrane repeat protein [Methanobrevibacter gottschalkii DSM 11977]
MIGVVCAEDNNVTENATNEDFQAIQILIDNANPGDSIYLENKTYQGSGSPIIVNKSVNVYGVDSSKTILDASNKSSIFLISKDVKVNFNGLTLTNGYNETKGGAIYNLGILNITNSKISSNYAESGAIRNEGTGKLTISNSLFDKNCGSFGAAIDNYVGYLNIVDTTFTNNDCLEGGAIYNRFGEFLVYNCTFINNSAARGGGVYNNRGGMYIYNSRFIANNVYDLGGGIKSWGSCEVYNTVLINNTAKQGGGIYVSEFTLIAENCFVENNSAHWGGGIAVEAKATAKIKNATIINNLADRGAGIDINMGSIDLQDSIVNNNVAKYGAGGIYFALLSSTVKNTYICNNIANTSGGGCYIYGFRGVVVNFTNVIINNNSASKGGAIYSTGTANIQNSILNSNNAYKGGAIYNELNLTVKDSQFFENTADSWGGAIYNNLNSFIDNVVLNSNEVKQFGGAIYNEKLVNAKNSLFESNKALQAGAIYSTNDLIIDNSQFIKNYVKRNYCVLMLSKGDVNITNSLFKFNTNADEGGCIFNYNANLLIDASQFISNDARSYGAAIDNSGNLTIKNSLFYKNKAYGAAAIDNSGNLVIIKSNFTDNVATNNGGAIDSNGKLIIIGSIFKNNLAGNNGGALILRGDTTVTHSIIYNNHDKNGYAIFNKGVENISLSNNWWGSNNPDFEKLLNMGTSDDFNWIIMSFSSNNQLIQYKNSILNINFDNVKDKMGNVYKINSTELLPIFKIALSNYGEVTISNGFKSMNKNIPLITSISAKIDNQSIILKITPTNKRIIDNKNIVVDYNGKVTYKVRVVGVDGKIVGANVAVVMKIAGKKYTVKTNKNGFVSKLFSLTPGKYSIITTYKGFTVKNSITVKKVLYAKSITKKKSKKITYSVSLKISNGKPIAGKKITFKIKSKTYTAKTNKKGVAVVSFKNLKVGKYSVIVNYLNSKVKTTLKIK